MTTSSTPTSTASRRCRGRRLVRAGIVAALGSAMLAGGVATAGSEPAADDRDDRDLDGTGLDITFVQGVIGDEFYVSMECGVRVAAEELGANVEVQGPDQFDATMQNPILDAVVASAPDAILVAPNDVEASAGPLERAEEEGIAVILVDTVVDDPDIGASRIASDNFGGGQAAADALAELVGEEGKVLVVNVQPGVSTTDLRQQGFEERIAEYPDIEYLGTEFSRNEPARAAEIVTATLAAHPDLAGVFATNLFSAQGTATGLLQSGRQGDVQVVGFDAGPAQVEQLVEGDVQALVMQKPYDIGYLGVYEAVAAVTGEEVTPQIQTDFVIATGDNLDDDEVNQYFYRASCE